MIIRRGLGPLALLCLLAVRAHGSNPVVLNQGMADPHVHVFQVQFCRVAVLRDIVVQQCLVRTTL